MYITFQLQFSGHDINDDEVCTNLLRDEESGQDFSNPPSFVNNFEALQYQMKRLEGKIEQLDKLQKIHVNRVQLDENSQEESDIKRLTTEVSEVKLFSLSKIWVNESFYFLRFRCSRRAIFN